MANPFSEQHYLPTHGDGDHGSHVTNFALLVKVFIILLVLMGVTIGASYVEIGTFLWIPGLVWNNLVALLIATVKACFVIWIFMGVKFSSTLTRIWVVAGFLVLTIMFGILGDYATRRFEPVQGWERGVPHSGGETSLPREWPPSDRVRPTPPVEQNLRPRG